MAPARCDEIVSGAFTPAIDSYAPAVSCSRCDDTIRRYFRTITGSSGSTSSRGLWPRAPRIRSPRRHLPYADQPVGVGPGGQARSRGPGGRCPGAGPQPQPAPDSLWTPLTEAEARDTLRPLFREGSELAEIWSGCSDLPLETVREIVHGADGDEIALRTIAVDVFRVQESDETLWDDSYALAAAKGEGADELREVMALWRFLGSDFKGHGGWSTADSFGTSPTSSTS